MIPKMLKDILLEDLEALVGRVREGKSLEFKSELPSGKSGSLKVLTGVSALANTAGGDRPSLKHLELLQGVGLTVSSVETSLI